MLIQSISSASDPQAVNKQRDKAINKRNDISNLGEQAILYHLLKELGNVELGHNTPS